MCYAPTRKSTELIKRAIDRISEGKLPEAKRLLAAAQMQMSRVVNIVYDGKRVGEWYQEAQQALLQAERSGVKR